MFEKQEPKFWGKPEQGTVTKEKPLDRLRESIKEMSLELQKEGVPVDDSARIDPSKFGDVYLKHSIEADKAWVKDLKGRWERTAIANSQLFWASPKEKALKGQPVGEVWEMLSTLILQKNLGKDFIVARTSEYDDARYKVDNIILDRKTGHIVCAFDEVGETAGRVFEEKKENILNRNRQRGGTDLKYGISFKALPAGRQEKGGKMKLEKGSVYQIPLLYMASSDEDIKKALADPDHQKKVFGDFLDSAKQQIKEIKEGPIHPKLKARLDFFEEVIGKL